MLDIENRTSAHARVQHCCTNLAKRLHHATSTNVPRARCRFKFELTTPNMSQHFETRHNRVKTHAKMLRHDVALKFCYRLAGALHVIRHLLVYLYLYLVLCNSKVRSFSTSSEATLTTFTTQGLPLGVVMLSQAKTLPCAPVPIRSP